MRILALDPATKCGWAWGNGVVRESGTWNLTPLRDESKGMRLIRFRSKLATVAPLGIDLVVFESARAAGGHLGAIVVQSEIQGVLKLWCEESGITYRGYSSTEIKKFATGKGNAKKDDMVAAVRAKYSPDVADDNEADAVALWHLAMSEYGSGA